MAPRQHQPHCHQLLESFLAAEKMRLRETILKISHQRGWVVAKQDCADPSVSHRDKDRAKRILADGEAD
jgi:hypothetical protein